MDQNTQNNNNNDQIEKNIAEIQKQIALNLGISDLSDEKQKQIVEKATEVLIRKIFITTIEKLSEEDKNIYLDFVEKGAEPQEIEKFLNEKIPNFIEMRQKIIVDFFTEMKNKVSQG